MVAKEVSHALALHRGISAVPRGSYKLEPRENPFTQITHYRPPQWKLSNALLVIGFPMLKLSSKPKSFYSSG